MMKATVAQELRLAGTILSSADSTPVPFAFVVNNRTADGITADENGAFTIYIQPADSILVSALSYRKILLLIPPEAAQIAPMTIYLEPTPYQLDTVVIRMMPPKELFPWAFRNLQLAEENAIKLNIPENVMQLDLPVEANESRVRAPNEIPSWGMINIPLNFNSRAAKFEKQKEKLDSQKYMLQEIERKYSNEFISRITGLEEEEEIIELKKRCNLSNDFILSKSEYEIALAVLDCLKDLEKKN